jgi:hypothetical protein
MIDDRGVSERERFYRTTKDKKVLRLLAKDEYESGYKVVWIYSY